MNTGSSGGMLRVAKQLRIPTDKVYVTGSNKAKIEKVKELKLTSRKLLV